jgi:DNA polymerase-1
VNYFIVDAFNLAYRAHNVNFELKTASGKFSGMCFGFIRMLYSLKKKYRGYKFVVVWDSRPDHKYKIQQDYKADRAGLPPSIMAQVDDIKEFLEHAGIDQYFKKGQEADDVIATLAERFKKEGSNTVLVYSNDKDLLQLVETGKVVVYRPKVGNSPEKFYDEEAVKDQFGVGPERLSCYRSFDGDNSDNIHGISRVPRKIIASLVNRYGDLTSVYENLDSERLTPFQKKSFQEGKGRVSNNYRLIHLDRNLSDISHIASRMDRQKMQEVLDSYEIKSLNIDNMAEIFGSELTIRYTDAKPAVEIESYSLFE